MSSQPPVSSDNTQSQEASAADPAQNAAPEQSPRSAQESQPVENTAEGQSPSPAEPVAAERPSEEPAPSPQPEAFDSGAPSAAQAEQAAADQRSAEPPAESAAAPEAVPEPEAAKPGPRVQLRPSVAPDQDKAVPSLGSDSGGAGQAEKPTEEEAQASAPAPTQAPSPVDLPPRVEDLDADLEAEIEAAMSGVGSGAAQIPVPAAEGEEAAAPQEQLDEESLEQGTRLKGTVQSVHGDDVFVDAGLRSACVIPVRQFGENPPEVGQKIDFLVARYDAEQGLVLANLPAGREQVAGNWDAVAPGQVVDCLVTKKNKGGLEVTVGGLRGFLPAGQVDLRYIGDLEPFINEKLTVKITEVNRQRRNIVVSRRALLEEERREAERTAWETLEVGQKITGTVKTIKDYGAFVDLGGVDGFLHIGQISWSRIDHPNEVLSEGQQVDVKILSLEKEKKKIGLGMRQLTQSPWVQAPNKYAPGAVVNGKVTRTMDFGAFVELEPGLEGLVHISELDFRRVNRVTDVLKAGQDIDVQVLEVDPQKKRISLSVKALKTKPEEQAEESDESTEETVVRKRKGPLKGGTTSGSGSGLFGNPEDYH